MNIKSDMNVSSDIVTLSVRNTGIFQLYSNARKL